MEEVLTQRDNKISKRNQMSIETVSVEGSCLKTGQHFIFVIINLLLTIKCIIFDSVSKILFIFFIANNNNYDSNIKNILLHNGYKNHQFAVSNIHVSIYNFPYT